MCDEPEVSVWYDSECVSQKAVKETLEKKAKSDRKQRIYQVWQLFGGARIISGLC